MSRKMSCNFKESILTISKSAPCPDWQYRKTDDKEEKNWNIGTYHIKADTMDRRKNLGLVENVHKIEDWVLILPPL